MVMSIETPRMPEGPRRVRARLEAEGIVLGARHCECGEAHIVED